MTYKEAIETGYKVYEIRYTPKYISRKRPIEQEEIKIAGGTRKWELYIETFNRNSTRFSYRMYLRKEV